MYKFIAPILLLISSISYASENAVSEIDGKLNESNNILSIHDLSEYLKKYKYQQWIPDNTFFSLITYTDAPEQPQMVAIISFHNDKLFSIVTTSMKSLKIKSKRKAGSLYIYYFIDNRALINEYEEKYLKGITWAE